MKRKGTKEFEIIRRHKFLFAAAVFPAGKQTGYRLQECFSPIHGIQIMSIFMHNKMLAS
jgi:hypothetical protein